MNVRTVWFGTGISIWPMAIATGVIVMSLKVRFAPCLPDHVQRGDRGDHHRPVVRFPRETDRNFHQSVTA